ncbi:hypothetical protein KM043_018846 [Ampulex compressa]|nr:hypothetical protein KM043_018846 [Ampulex compressa]
MATNFQNKPEAPTSQMGNNLSVDLLKDKSTIKHSQKKQRIHSSSWSKIGNQYPKETIPRFVVIEKEKGSFTNVSPFLIDRILTNLIGKVQRVQKLNNSLLVETVSDSQSKTLLGLTNFGDMAVHTSAHKSLNYNKGIITCPDLLNCTIEELQSELADQGIIDVRRITRKRDGEIMPTASIILTFNKPTLPDKIKAGFHSINVRTYIPNPMRCFRCQRYGHTSINCNNDEVCACGSPPHVNLQCSLPMSCVNCGNQHSARSRNCPTFKQELEIQRIRVTNKIPYSEARRQVKLNSRNKPTSYAEITGHNTMANQQNIVKELTTLLIPEISKIVQTQIKTEIAPIKLLLNRPTLTEPTDATKEKSKQAPRKERCLRYSYGTSTPPTDKDLSTHELIRERNVSLQNLGIKTINLKQSNKKFITTEYEESDMEVDTPTPNLTTLDTSTISNTNDVQIQNTFPQQIHSKSTEKTNEPSSSDSSIISAPKLKSTRKKKPEK